MKETSYSDEEVKNFKELLNHSINLYGDNNIFKFKKRMYKKGETEKLLEAIWFLFN